MASAVLPRRSARVMPGRESISAELAHDVVQQRVELHVLVARDAGVGCLAAGVRVDEAIDDALTEHVRVVEGVERDAERGGRAARVLPGLVRPTAARRVDVAARWHEPHPYANDVLAALRKDRRRDRRVDASADRQRFASGAPAGEPREGRRCLGRHLAAGCGHARLHDDAALDIHFDLHPVAITRIRVAAEAAGQTATAAESRSRATTPASASTNRSTSAAVVDLPTVTRSEPFASSRSIPSASRTCEGSVSPEVHAEPLDTANPSRSRATMSDSPSVPGMQKEALFGRRSVGCPFSTASGTRARTPAMTRSRSVAWRGDSVGRWSRAMRIAAPRPTIPATFSVPVRRPFSWPPPVCIVAMRVPRRTYSAPTPFGP